MLQRLFPSPSGDERGSLLVVSLWVIATLTAFSISTGYSVRQRITLADRLESRGALQGLAEAGIYQALAELKPSEPAPSYHLLSEPWSSSPKLFKKISIGPGSFSVSYEYGDVKANEIKIRYGMQDEESKINVNTASPEIIGRILQMEAELDDDEAGKIADAVVDWRDSDSFLNDPIYGAEDNYYEDLEFSYGAKDKPMEVLSELLLVRSMTGEIYDKVVDKLTIYGSGAVNINTASKEVLLALGLTENLVDKILAYRAGTDGEEGTKDDRAFVQVAVVTADLSRVYTSLPTYEVMALSNLVSANLITTASTHFRVHSIGRLDAKGIGFDITAVVTREGKVVSWSVGALRPLTEAEKAEQSEEEALTPQPA